MDGLVFFGLFIIIAFSIAGYIIAVKSKHSITVPRTTYNKDGIKGFVTVPNIKNRRKNQFIAHYTKLDGPDLWPDSSNLIFEKLGDKHIFVPGAFYMFINDLPYNETPTSYLAKCTGFTELGLPKFDRPWKYGFNCAGYLIGFKFNSIVTYLDQFNNGRGNNSTINK